MGDAALPPCFDNAQEMLHIESSARMRLLIRERVIGPYRELETVTKPHPAPAQPDWSPTYCCNSVAVLWFLLDLVRFHHPRLYAPGRWTFWRLRRGHVYGRSAVGLHR